MRLIRVFFRTFLSNRSWDSFDCYESTPETCCFKPYSFRCIISKLTTIQWRQKDKSHTCALNRSLTISVIFKKKEVHKLYTHDIKRVLNNIYIFPSYMFTHIYMNQKFGSYVKCSYLVLRNSWSEYWIAALITSMSLINWCWNTKKHWKKRTPCKPWSYFV